MNHYDKIIIEFLGIKSYECTDLNFRKWDCTDCPDLKPMLHDRLITTPTKFDSDWNWLMPVVDKINSIVFKQNDKLEELDYTMFTSDFDVHISKQECRIIIDNDVLFKKGTIKTNGSWDKHKFYNGVGNNTMFSNTFNVVVDFIEWYLYTYLPALK